MSRSAWMRDVAKLADEFGCSTQVTPGGHIKLKHPTGWFAFAPSTPGDHRSLANLKSDLRRKRAGVWR